LELAMIWEEIEGQVEEFSAIIRNIPGVICHKSGDDSNYYTLPTGHILRLANHPSFDLAGQSADIYINPRGDGRNCVIAQFVLRTFIGYDYQKKRNIYFKRKINFSNLLTTLANACTIRKPRAYNSYFDNSFCS
jgi:hypothetical protein